MNHSCSFVLLILLNCPVLEATPFERPEFPDWRIDLTEFSKAVFGTLLKRPGPLLVICRRAEFAECSESPQAAR